MNFEQMREEKVLKIEAILRKYLPAEEDLQKEIM